MTIRAIVLDIEGTITPISFVRDVLFPFARARLPGFLASHTADPAVAAEIAAIKRLAPGTDVLQALLGWIDQDAKAPPLKTLQGLIWRSGYDEGVLKGRIYPDVPDCLRRWRAQGLRLYIYSSGSVAAQRLLLGHSGAGDLCPLFDGYFDTAVGAKREAASYYAIARAIGLTGQECRFLSDSEAELDAAHTAGWDTIQLVREADATVASERHRNWTICLADGGDRNEHN